MHVLHLKTAFNRICSNNQRIHNETPMQMAIQNVHIVYRFRKIFDHSSKHLLLFTGTWFRGGKSPGGCQ